MKKSNLSGLVLALLIIMQLMMIGCGGSGEGVTPSASGDAGTPQDESSTHYFFVSDLISEATGTYSGVPVFGLAPSASAISTEFGALIIDPDSSISFSVPSDIVIPATGLLLELQINYLTVDESADEYAEASFRLENDEGEAIAEGLLDNDDYASHQTYTLQIDLLPHADTTYVKLINTSSTYSLSVNNTISFLPIETVNEAGIYVADLRLTSSRIDVDATDASATDWSDAISTPGNYLEDGDVVFGLDDIIAGMTQPVIEFNFGREDDNSSDVYLYDDQDTQIAYYAADYDSYEDMGQAFIVDISAYKDSTYFRLTLDGDEYLNPFVKVYDAAVTSESAVLIDVSPTGAAFIAATGNFTFYNTHEDYTDGGMYDDDIGYGMPHWLADPTHETYGSGGTLEFALPAAVAAFNHPVLEILHFSPDSSTFLADGSTPGNPDNFPVEFFILDENDNEVAHIFFGEWEDDTGGVLKNQIPLGAFKNSASLIIKVPADATRWSQAALPPFIKIMDVSVPTL